MNDKTFLALHIIFLAGFSFYQGTVNGEKLDEQQAILDSLQDQLNVLSQQYNEDKQWFEENKAKLRKVIHFIPGDDILVHE